MTQDKHYFLCLKGNERLVVGEMIRDPFSIYWEECIKFVKLCVYANAKNIPASLYEDIIQEAMYKITRYLPHFRFQCALKTWLFKIIKSCIIDMYRRIQHEGLYQSSSVDPLNESDLEDEELITSEASYIEDAFETNEAIRDGAAALLEYADMHSDPSRNRLIIRMVIFEGQTYAETAVAVGCNAPVVSYVVREAQRHAREKMGYKL